MSSTFTQFKNHGGTGILHVTSRSTINLYGCRFKQCRGSIVLEAVDAFVKITHSSFLNTLSIYSVLYLTDSVLYTTHSNFINNSNVLIARNTNLKKSQNRFIKNSHRSLFVYGGIISIDKCNFINNTAKSDVFDAIVSIQGSTRWLSVTHNTFKNNEVFSGIVSIYYSTDNIILLLASSPGSLSFFNVTRRKTREPGKIYHVRDVGIEATWPIWSAVRVNHDSVVFDGNRGEMKDRRSDCTNDCSAI